MMMNMKMMEKDTIDYEEDNLDVLEIILNELKGVACSLDDINRTLKQTNHILYKNVQSKKEI